MSLLNNKVTKSKDDEVIPIEPPNEAHSEKQSKAHKPPIGSSKIELSPSGNSYEVDGVSLERVTRFINQYKKPFNPLAVAIGVTSTNKKKGVPSLLAPQELVHYWNLLSLRSTSLGTAAHVFAEMYLMNPTVTTPVLPKEYAVLKFLKFIEGKYEILGCELRTFSKKYQLAGTIDLLLRNLSTGKYIIGDWKTSVDIDKSYSKMLPPFEKYNQCKRSDYEVQLTTYKFLGSIEMGSGQILRVSPEDFECSILIILKDDGNYTIEKVDTIDQQLVLQELEKRANYENVIEDLV